MNKHSVTIATHTYTSAKSKKCSCGCDCEEGCCSLQCIGRPLFHCGQLLTDRPLTALAEYARQKASLVRYRDGWGVACGLEVRCDPSDCGRVIVGPGYALSCCGEDILVCEDLLLDLTKYCCAREDCNCPGDMDGAKTDARQAFDIYVRFREEMKDPQAVFGRTSACNCGSPGCDYTQALETAAVWAVPAPINSDPMEIQANRWLAGYNKCLDEVLDELVAPLQTAKPLSAAGVRQLLLPWLDRHPLHQFCFVRDRICNLKDEEVLEKKLAALLFFIIQDCRNAYVACDCHACTSQSGVPLARVYVNSDEEHGCSVECIDAHPPYRRPLRQDCWPAPLGYVNLAQVLWHRFPDAMDTLRSLGVPVSPQPFTIPISLADLKGLRGDSKLWASPGAHPALLYLNLTDPDYKDDPCFAGPRIIGFGQGPSMLVANPASDPLPAPAPADGQAQPASRRRRGARNG